MVLLDHELLAVADVDARCRRLGSDAAPLQVIADAVGCGRTAHGRDGAWTVFYEEVVAFFIDE